MPSSNSGLLVVIDSSVPNHDLLASGVHPTAQVAFLRQGSGLGGVLQLLSRTHGPARELHLVAHGAPGVLYLGGEGWTAETVRARAGDWAAVGRALGPDGVIALTACYVAFGDEGRALLAAIAEAAGCRVTGTEGLVGGNRAESFAFAAADAGNLPVQTPFPAHTRASYSPMLVGLGFPDLAAGSDSGISNTDNITNHQTLTVQILTSQLVLGATLTIDYGSGLGFQFPKLVFTGQQTVTWVTGGFADGIYNIRVREEVFAGGTTIVGPLVVTVDTVAQLSNLQLDPISDTGTSSSDKVTADTTPTIHFTYEAGAQVEVDWGNGGGYVLASAYGAGLVTATLAAPYASDGLKNISVRVTDVAGNVATQVLAVTIDSTAPQVSALLQNTSDTGFSDGDRITSDTTPTISYTAEAGAVVKVDWADGNGFVDLGISDGTETTLTFLAGYQTDGLKAIKVQATDIAGNVSVYNLNVTIDTIPPGFYPVLPLSAIEQGFGGFAIFGDGNQSYFGRSVDGAGDVNGDGIPDVIVGGDSFNHTAGGNDGAALVVFGKTNDTTPVEMSDIEAGTGGFAIYGLTTRDFAGYSVAGAGDVNGDGLDDLIVGAYGNDQNGSYAGAGFVVFGKSGNTNSVNLSEIVSGNGGFAMFGEAEENYAGWSLNGGGDIKGDGLDDLIVGAWQAEGSSFNSGATYVVFGKSCNTTAIELSDVRAGSGGFIVKGISNSDESGISVSNAGDVNGDGLDDLVIGADRADPNGSLSGASYVVFGKSDGSAIDLSAIQAGNHGFTINGATAGDLAGYSVSGAGDVNGDGLDDVMIGAAGADTVYVVFGKTGSATVELSAVAAGAGGFAINHVGIYDGTGRSAGALGDMNGDGLDDLIVGAPASQLSGTDAGAAFVVFGKTDGSAVELSTIGAGVGGFGLAGAVSGDRAGSSVSGIGDMNGDGLPDLIIGAKDADNNVSQDGTAYVVFGRPVAALHPASDTGLSQTDGVTSDRMPTIAFFPVENAELEIDWGNGNGFIPEGTATGPVDIRVAPGLYVGEGVKTIKLRMTDAAGNTHTEQFQFTLDLTPTQGPDIINRSDSALNLTIDGLGGDDVLTGGSGNDILIGGPGADALDGGKGTDKATYFSSAAGVLVDIAFTGANTGDAAGDTFISIENLEGSTFDDSLRGNDSVNTIIASAGNDTVFGRGGNDRLLGNAGDDILIGGTGGDSLEGGGGQDEARYHQASGGLKIDLASAHVNTGEAAGDTYTSIENLFGSNFADTVSGDDFANVLSGHGGNDTIFGRGGADLLLGGDGDDNLIGGAGVDHYNGGNGIDRVQYQESANGLRVDLQVQATNTGEAAGETYLLIEDIVSSSGNDSLFGNASANKLYGFDGVDRVFGRAGDDILFGGDGNDIVNGGAGDDILVGGADVDTFRFDGVDFGSDRILDFTPGEVIDLKFYAGLTFADLTIVDVAGRAEISFANGEIVLTGIQAASVVQGWFDFAP